MAPPAAVKTSLAAIFAWLLLVPESTAAQPLQQLSYGLPRVKAKICDSAMVEYAFRQCPAAVPSDTVVLRFIGDVMLHKAQIDNARREDGSFEFSGYFRGIAQDIAEADIAVANMEFTLAGEPYTGYPAFSAPDSYARYMAQCGIDVFLTANNHILDKGEKGLLRTLAVYRELGERYGTRMTGSAESPEDSDGNYPLMLNVKGMRIAFVNFTYGTNTGFGKKYPGTNLSVKSDILEALRRAERLGADFTIALPHWGEEYSTSHSPAQEELAQWLAENGADLVVGTHPHVVQDIGTVEVKEGPGQGYTPAARTKRVAVVYSLGNAISNMSAKNTQIGLLLEVRIPAGCFGDAGEPELGFTFLWSSLPGRLAECHTAVKVKDYLSRRDEWILGYEYDKMVSSYYRVKGLTGIED